MKNSMKFYSIVAHGMNLHPARMGEFEKMLQNWGGGTYNLVFRGHRPGEVDLYNTAQTEHWFSDLDRAFGYYKANYSDLPLFYLGYSLGGLVGVSYLQKNEEFKTAMKKMVLVAPALAPRDYLVWIARTTGYPNVPVPSLNIKNYNVHKWSSIRVNNEIYKLIKGLRPPKSSEALVLLNRKDELISYAGTAKFIQDRELQNWKIYDLKPARSWRQPMPQHLIVDEKTMGKKAWEDSQREIYSFLKI